MRARTLWILLLSAALATAGCLQGAPVGGEDGLSPSSDPDEGTNRTSDDENASEQRNGTEDRNGTAERDRGNQTDEDEGDGNATGPNGTGSDDAEAQQGWPPVDQASIRPGVQVVAANSLCTTNFLFRTPDNASLYLGTAAHCVENVDLGDTVELAGGEARGILAYSSWKTLEAMDADSDQATRQNDFALILIPQEERGKVHPAVRHFGGPTGVAPADQLDLGDTVNRYGNTYLRMGVEPTNWHEGVIVDRPNPWTVRMYTVHPGLPGDSGSPVMLDDGRAAGIFVALEVLPVAGAQDVVVLDTALSFANENGMNVELVPWDDVNPGIVS